MSSVLRLRLTRSGLQTTDAARSTVRRAATDPVIDDRCASTAASADVLALDDPAAWQQQAIELLRAIDPASWSGRCIDVLVDTDLTLAGVLHGPMWTLPEAELEAAAQTWCVQQSGSSGWRVCVAAQSDGRHAVVAALPAAPLIGLTAAIEQVGARLRRVAPSWALALAALEDRSSVRAALGASPAGVGAFMLQAHRANGVWQSVDVRPLVPEHARTQEAAAASGSIWIDEPLRSDPLREDQQDGALPLTCRADSLATLDFHRRPERGATRGAKVALSLAATAACVSLVAALLEWSVWSQARGALAQAPAPRQTVALAPARAPVAPEVLTALAAELSQPWLPMLDRVARTRPADIQLQRVEPAAAGGTASGVGAGSGSGAGHAMRLSVSGQASAPAAVLAWLRKLGADPELASPRLIGWQREGEDSTVTFQLEVADAARR